MQNSVEAFSEPKSQRAQNLISEDQSRTNSWTITKATHECFCTAIVYCVFWTCLLKAMSPNVALEGWRSSALDGSFCSACSTRSHAVAAVAGLAESPVTGAVNNAGYNVRHSLNALCQRLESHFQHYQASSISESTLVTFFSSGLGLLGP